METIEQQFTQHSGFVPERAQNDRIGGKLLLHDYLRWTPKPKARDVVGTFDAELAQKILRNYGKAKYDEYVKFFEEEPDELNLPKLQIFNHCQEIIDCIPDCVADPNNPEDVAEFPGDDPYDGCRYLLQAITRFKEKAGWQQQNFMAAEKVNQLYQQGIQMRDLTSFYIQAPNINRKTSTPFAVRGRRRR